MKRERETLVSRAGGKRQGEKNAKGRYISFTKKFDRDFDHQRRYLDVDSCTDHQPTLDNNWRLRLLMIMRKCSVFDEFSEREKSKATQERSVVMICPQAKKKNLVGHEKTPKSSPNVEEGGQTHIHRYWKACCPLLSNHEQTAKRRSKSK